MSLAYWVNAGVLSPEKTEEIQRKLVALRSADKIPDIIFCMQNSPHVSFGSSVRYNSFSNHFLEEVNASKGAISEDNAIDLLREKRIGFVRAERGGGSAYIGPGQFLVYPIVNYGRIVGDDISKYKSLLDRIMISVLSQYNIRAHSVDVSKTIGDLDNDDLRTDRKDIWVIKDGKNYKIGAKGIKVSLGNGISHYGFDLFVQESGISGFDYVNACGYPREILDVTCIEREIKNYVSINDVEFRVLGEIRKEFGYGEIMAIELGEILNRSGEVI